MIDPGDPGHRWRFQRRPVSDPDALKDYIARKNATDGTYLSVLGFGRGNLDDATMQALAQNGNGQAAYIDTLSEARKVLVDQLTGALLPDSKRCEDPDRVQSSDVIAEYRLIGYETRALAREDFNNDRVDGGRYRSRPHSVTAIYEDRAGRIGRRAERSAALCLGGADAAGPDGRTWVLEVCATRHRARRTSVLIEDANSGRPGRGARTVMLAFCSRDRGLRAACCSGSDDLLEGWGYAEADRTGERRPAEMTPSGIGWKR